MALLSRCRARNIQLNADKFKFKVQEVSYAGHVFTSEGLKVDPDKVTTIEQITAPTDKAGVRRLLGMINYLSRFVPNLTDLAEPLRQLTREGNLFERGPIQQHVFSIIEKAITAAPVLK